MELKQDTVLVEVKNGVALIKYNRPQSGNSLHPQVLTEMRMAFKYAEDHSDVKVIVQTGEGKFFSTGMELMDVKKNTSGTSFEEDGEFFDLTRRLIDSKKVLIAAVNGPAAGFGMSSLSLFDLVYSVPDAYFFTPFVRWGWAPEGTSSISFPMIMGYQKAAALVLAADRISATDLERTGMITKILEKERFLEQVMQIAERIAQAPLGSLMISKALMREPLRQQQLDAHKRECAALRQREATGEPQQIMQEYKVEREQKKSQQKQSKL